MGCMLRAADTGVVYSLIAPTVPVGPGATVEVQLAILNRSSSELRSGLPGTLNGKISAQGSQWTVVLHSRDDAAPGTRTIAPGTFALRTFTMTLPSGLPAGAATLDIQAADVGPTRTGLEIAASKSDLDRLAGPTQRPTTNLIRAQPVAVALRRTFADRLAPHEPTYFIYGPEAPGAKFQITFKYKLLDFSGAAPKPRTRMLHFAFTQRSLWDIAGDSSPFYDTSYMPELMYEALATKPEESDRVFTWLGFQAAYKHESNGRDGPLSRSLDIVYARTVLALGRLDGWHLLAMPELSAYVGSKEDNVGIEDYRGYGKLRLLAGRHDGPSLMATFWAGKDFENLSTQLDLTFPVRTRLLNFETYLLVQYFDGFGESLLSYREKSRTVRAGISLVR